MKFKSIVINKSILKNYQNSVLYLGGSLLQLLISLFTFPIYSTYLSAAEFGIIGYFTSIMLFFTPIFVLSTTNIYVMKYFRQTETENKKLLFNLIFFLSILNSFTLLISYIGLFTYFKYTSVTISFYPYSLIVLFTIFFEVFKTFTLLNYRIRKQAKQFFILSSVGPILNALISIYFVAYLELGASGRLGGILVSKIIVAMICFGVLRKYLFFKIDFKIFRKAIVLAAPLIIAAYAYIPIQSLDRIFLERIGDTGELGYYSIGSQIAGFLVVASAALFQAFEPDIYKYVVNKNKKKLLMTLGVFTGTNLIGLLAFLLLSPFIFELLTKSKYTDAYIYGNLIAIGGTFMGLLQMISSLLLAQEKTRLTAIIIYVGGLSSIFIYYFFIQKWGFMGATYGRITVPLLMILTGVFLVLRVYKNQLLNIKL